MQIRLVSKIDSETGIGLYCDSVIESKSWNISPTVETYKYIFFKKEKVMDCKDESWETKDMYLLIVINCRYLKNQ